MQNSDLQAIREFNTKEYTYLSVKKENGKEYLEVKTKNWLGRLWMWLGFSNASMKKITDYIERHKEFQNLEKQDKTKLFEKVFKYKQKKLKTNYEKKINSLIGKNQYEELIKVLEEVETLKAPLQTSSKDFALSMIVQNLDYSKEGAFEKGIFWTKQIEDLPSRKDKIEWLLRHRPEAGENRLNKMIDLIDEETATFIYQKLEEKLKCKNELQEKETLIEYLTRVKEFDLAQKLKRTSNEY